jgi:hypothetical protein
MTPANNQDVPVCVSKTTIDRNSGIFKEEMTDINNHVHPDAGYIGQCKKAE